ncbi:SPL family radical SAM protein [Halocatena salina]|uniref:Radical SAM protein n=1 Tax=Halocatena salina TaxID=2934340 RepID=A0A8U0A7N3_9EURY|nr:radical SAM protein [Halocatena salina]UPM44846.1 radical SAM protein [Halocatena salina]
MKRNEITTGDDPTKAVLSESGLHSKHLCDYVINVATGCKHGCKFCYVPSTPNIRARPEMLKEHADVDQPQREWGQYVLYRDSIIDRIDGILNRKRTWKRTPQGCGIVGISFATDCYMDGRAGKITRKVVQSLAEHDRYARVLTRNPILALQDADVFVEAGENVTIGSSIPCMNAEHVHAIEPRTPPPEHRLRGLKEFSEMGVNTYVSLSPTYPTQSRSDLHEQLERIAECEPSVIFHEPINPRSGNFQMTVQAAKAAGQNELAMELERLRDRDQWAEYAVTQLRWVQELGEGLDLPVHLWPDKSLLKHVPTDVADWLRGWRNRQSPEGFADRETPTTSPPSLEQPNLRTWA